MKILEYAENEFNILTKTAPDHLALEFKDEILAFVKKFAESGQSGASAPYTSSAITNVIRKLLSFEPLEPLEDNPDDWAPIEQGSSLLQNKRLSALFKENGVPKYLDAIAYIDEDTGVSFTTNSISSVPYVSSQEVKFPFIPKTFYLHIYEDNKGKYAISRQDEFNKTLEEARKFYILKANTEYYESI